MKFSMSEAWRDAVAMMTANREVLLIVAGIFFLLPSLVTAMAMPGLQEKLLADPTNASAALTQIMADWGWTLVVVGVCLGLAQIVGYLAMLALLRDTSRPTVSEALKAGVAGILPAIGYYIVIALGAFVLVFAVTALMVASPALGVVLLLVFLVLAVYAMVKLSLALPVIAIEKVSNPIAAISRSWGLTKGNSFRLLLFFVLLVIVYMVISIVLSAVLGLVFSVAGTSTALLLNGIVSAVMGCAFTVVFVAVIAAVHRQLAGPSAEAVSATFE